MPHIDITQLEQQEQDQRQLSRSKLDPKRAEYYQKKYSCITADHVNQLQYGPSTGCLVITLTDNECSYLKNGYDISLSRCIGREVYNSNMYRRITFFEVFSDPIVQTPYPMQNLMKC